MRQATAAGSDDSTVARSIGRILAVPIDRSEVPANIFAGITLAALAIPEVLGYARIAGSSRT